MGIEPNSEKNNLLIWLGEFVRQSRKFHKIRLWLYLLIGVLALLVISAIGCGEESNLQETVSTAIGATSDLQSYRSSQIQIQTANGEIMRNVSQSESIEPDLHRSQSIGPEGWSENVIIGEKCYVRNSAQPNWHIPRGVCILTSLKDELMILHSLVNLQALQDEEINNIDCLHYFGNIDFDSYSKMKTSNNTKLDTIDQLHNWEGEVDLWIAKNNSLIHKIEAKLRWPIKLDGNTEESWCMLTSIKYFYDFNEVSHIEPPQLDQ